MKSNDLNLLEAEGHEWISKISNWLLISSINVKIMPSQSFQLSVYVSALAFNYTCDKVVSNIVFED